MAPKQKSQSQKKKERALANQRAINPDAGKPKFAPKSTKPAKPAKVASQPVANHHNTGRGRHFVNNSEEAWENDPELWDMYQEACKAINRPEEMEDVESDDEGSGTEKLRIALKKQEEKDHRAAVQKLIEDGVLKIDQDEIMGSNEKMAVANKDCHASKAAEARKDIISHKDDEIVQKDIDKFKLNEPKENREIKENPISEALENHHHQNENVVTKVSSIANDVDITFPNADKNDLPRCDLLHTNGKFKKGDGNKLEESIAQTEQQFFKEPSTHNGTPAVEHVIREPQIEATSVNHLAVQDLVDLNGLCDNVKNMVPAPASSNISLQSAVFVASTAQSDAHPGTDYQDASQSQTWLPTAPEKDDKKQASTSPDTLLSVPTGPTPLSKKVSPVAMVFSRIMQQTIQENNASNVTLPALNVLKQDTDLKDDDEREPTPVPRLNRKHSRLRSPNGQHALDLEESSWRSPLKEPAKNSNASVNDRKGHKKESNQLWRQQAPLEPQQGLGNSMTTAPAWRLLNGQQKTPDNRRLKINVDENKKPHGALDGERKAASRAKKDEPINFSEVDENASKRCTIFYCATKNIRRVLEPSKELVSSSSSHGKFKFKKCICGKALGAIMNRGAVLDIIQANNKASLVPDTRLLAYNISRIAKATTPLVMKQEANPVPPVSHEQGNARAASALRGRSQSLIEPHGKPKSFFMARPSPLRTQPNLMGAAAKYPAHKILARRHTTCQQVSESEPRISPPLLHSSDGEDELSEWEPVAKRNPPPFRDYALPSLTLPTRKYGTPQPAIPIILVTPSSDDETDAYKHNLAPLQALQQEPSRLIEPKRLSKPGRAKQMQARKKKMMRLQQQVLELQTQLVASKTVLPESDAESGVEAQSVRLEHVLMMEEESAVAVPKAPKTPSLIRKLAVSKPAPPVITKVGISLERAFRPKARPERKQVFVWETLE